MSRWRTTGGARPASHDPSRPATRRGLHRAHGATPSSTCRRAPGECPWRSRAPGGAIRRRPPRRSRSSVRVRAARADRRAASAISVGGKPESPARRTWPADARDASETAAGCRSAGRIDRAATPRRIIAMARRAVLAGFVLGAAVVLMNAKPAQSRMRRRDAERGVAAQREPGDRRSLDPFRRSSRTTSSAQRSTDGTASPASTRRGRGSPGGDPDRRGAPRRRIPHRGVAPRPWRRTSQSRPGRIR